MDIIGIRTPLFEAGDDLIKFITHHVPVLWEGDIVAITSKIVALSQGRIAPLSARTTLIYRDSLKVIETPWAFLTLTHDGWCINAGADESNANGGIILLPKNAQKTAEAIRKKFVRHFSHKHLGVLITDTKSVPLRVGTIGRAIGYAGFEPLKSYIGEKDLFGRKGRFTQSNVADALAASAVFIMGEGDEQTPIAIIRDAPVHFINIKQKSARPAHANLVISPGADIYAGAFRDAARGSHKPSKKIRRVR
ncbi:MAG: coenzyme F420-0:L-glutamate ligase [Patescibacteria group bacterium]